MTEKSLPWDGITLADAGPYGASVWQLFHQQVLSDQDAASDRGVKWTDYQDSLKVTEKGTPDMSVNVGPGSGMVDGCAYWSTATENLAVTAADPTLNRIDRVILRLDNTLGKVRLAVKAGTPGASPSPPTMQKDRSPYFEIPLYQIYVGAAVTTIVNANLTDERLWIGAHPPTTAYKYECANRNTTSTSFVSVGTPFEFTIITHGGFVIMDLDMEIHNSSSVYGNIDVEIDGTLYGDSTLGFGGGGTGGGLIRVLGLSQIKVQGFSGIQVPLAAGSHTFKLMWKTNSGTLQTEKTLFSIREAFAYQ